MVLDAGGHIPDCGIPLSSAYTALSLTPSVLCQWKYCISFFFSLGIGLFKKTVREREGKRKVEFQIKCGRSSAEGSWCGGRLPSQPDVEAMGGQRGGRGRLDPQQRVGREKAVCSCKKMLNGFSCFQPRESLILGLSEKRADSKGGKDFFFKCQRGREWLLGSSSFSFHSPSETRQCQRQHAQQSPKEIWRGRVVFLFACVLL